VIVRFFSHFPDLVDKAIDAMLDLCEDPVVDIRKQAIKDLPTLCRDNKANLPKITDVLTQVFAVISPSDPELFQIY
jgi:Apoptosis inhibitory protein 5 (API5)